MKRIFFSILLAATSSFAFAQDAQEFYSQDFGWRIKIPANFTIVPTENQTDLQNKGTKIVENTYGTEIVNQAKTLFMYQRGYMNYIEGNYQPFDTTENYLEQCKAVNDIVFETFKTQMPGSTIDSAYYRQTVGGLEFYVFKVDIHFPNSTIVFHGRMFSRPFKDRELAVNIMYVDEKIGKELLDAWLSSRFE